MSAVTSATLGAAVGALITVAASPYLARLTRTVPDQDAARWWTGAPAGVHRQRSAAALALVLGGLAGAAGRWTPLLPAFVVLAVLAVPLILIDIDHHRLPDRLMLPLAGATAVLLVVAAAATGDWHRLLRAVEGGAAVFAVLFALTLVAPNGFGLGDVKLGGVMGGYLGWFGWVHVYYGVFAGFLLGAVLSVGMLALRRATMKTQIPFGPMLMVGPLLVIAFDLVPAIA